MLQRIIYLFAICSALLACHTAQKAPVDQTLYQQLRAQRVQLPNQWMLTPAGKSAVQLGDLPLQICPSPNGKLLAITNNGVAAHKIQLIDATEPRLLHELELPKAWYGLAWSADGRYLYSSGGNDNVIVRLSVSNNQLRRDTAIRLGAVWPENKICPAGIALDDATQRLFTVSKEDSMLYVCNTRTLQVANKIKLTSEPYTVLASPANQRLFVSLWGQKQVLAYNLSTLKLEQTFAVGDHPNEMILNRAQDLLMVANSLDNSVSVIDLKQNKTLEVLQCALYPDAPNGATTNSLALSEDEKTLYVANADNNSLVVFDVSERGESRAKGFIPTGWYPTSVRFVQGKIIVANGKGNTSLANPKGPGPFDKEADEQAGEYIGQLFLGKLSVIEVPTESQMAAYSKLVYENCPYSKAKERQTEGEAGNPVPRKVGDPSPIKYVFYVIKENRTYDQVLGDLPRGNADPNLCIFPEKVSPNHHALANQFVLLDNFYVDAEVSADGHNWSTAAYANDFVEKTWPTSYGNRGGNYDFEGSRQVAFPKGGFIWDYCQRAGVSYRTYGEFADDYKANYPTLVGHICPGYSSWDMDIQDITREKVWEHDFDSLLAIGQVPRFNSIRFGNDHTSGMAKGAYSPTAAMADNDLAFGRLVEHISKSGIWKESAIFVLEDDAQNGPDHVDAHRSIAFVISPYIKRGYLDHTLYSTTSMLRTMELILGLPPMSQYDAAATPMWRAFTAKPDLTPYQAILPKVSLDDRNAGVGRLSEISSTFNLAQLDAVPERLFNEVLWKAIKGEDSEMPAPRRAAWLVTEEEEAER
jgi:6-phosphogluconolactonase (cycloisomerase 2 family)